MNQAAGKTRSGASGSSNGKRSRSTNVAELSEESPDPSAKKLLANNRYAVLENGDEPKLEKKEKLPPIYVKGFPEGLHARIAFFIEKGLRCTIRRSTEGFKLMVPGMSHYKAVLEILKQRNCEYFSHDIEAEKPLKVVLRGLHDMDSKELSAELEKNGLKPVQIFKMKRHDQTRTYRDQLYLVHFAKNSTCLKDLQNIRELFYIAVVWDRYKPVHRDVTQCSNCFMFGHGTRNCHMASRCINCGKTHDADACQHMKDGVPVCANCGAGHKPTSSTCPKRAEYIEIRKRASVNNQPGRKRNPRPPAVNDAQFPALQQRRAAPNLPPLPLNNVRNRSEPTAPTASNQVVPSGSSVQHRLMDAASQQNQTPLPGLSYSRVTSGTTAEGAPLNDKELVLLVSEVIRIQRTCKTLNEQLEAVLALVSKYGP